MDYYLAVDIGASSGRFILGSLYDGKIELEEIHRFSNGMKEYNGSLCWDIDSLFEEIKIGLKKCYTSHKIPKTMAIDTWGVDFVLLDENDKLIGDAVGYRDSRTAGMEEEVYKFVTESELYERTGIQKLTFNTIFQMMALKLQKPDFIEHAKTMLMIPDYLSFLLTGVKKQEYTNATTTQLVNAKTKNWDYEIIERLGFKKELFTELSSPGTLVGSFSKNIQEEIGFNCEVILCATHDTGSAVLSVPEENEYGIYISSGTWSLLGVELKEANCSLKSQIANFTNEGGYNYRFRFLKNIMGLWIIQSVKKELKDELSFPEIVKLAESVSFPSTIDYNDSSFFAPESMINAIKDYCIKTNQQIPETTAELAHVVYTSLAKCYADTISELEKITSKKYNSVYILGGGSNIDFLNKLTSTHTNKKVYAGPTEATAIGNIIVQMLHSNIFKDLTEAKKCILNSFDIKIYNPK